MELVNLEQLQAVLADYAKDIKENYISALASSDRKASGELINSVQTQVQIDGSVYFVTMDVAKYWKYVENDTRPHWPPPSAILRWIQVKPVIPRPGANGKIPTEKQLAFLISRKIATFGTEGSHDLERAKEHTIAFYRERISAALGHDMQNYILKVIANKG